jgi:hypothetical protein
MAVRPYPIGNREKVAHYKFTDIGAPSVAYSA